MYKTRFSKFIIFFLFTLLAGLIINCSGKKEYAAPEDVINANAKFMNEKDL